MLRTISYLAKGECCIRTETQKAWRTQQVHIIAGAPIIFIMVKDVELCTLVVLLAASIGQVCPPGEEFEKFHVLI